jgi:DMSO/TMAO reductase YedYZ molybdopterin-dependent catalytic subunit
MQRRDFLAAIARAGAASAVLSSLPRWARAATAAPAELIERNDWPEHWETTPLGLSRGWITANSRFFVRSHFPVPTSGTDGRVEVAGLIERPTSFSLAELRALGAVERVHVLECAGNGRGRFALPRTSGTQWDLGAVGNARWGGVPLAAVLEKVGVKSGAQHVWFEAADRAPLPGVPAFVRSIPIEKAHADALLADRMNGAPLPHLHGGPLRVIVPGWFGVASTKWVTRIRVEAAPSDNHFMVKGYRYAYPGADPATAPPVDELRIKSLVTQPLEGARVPRGRLRVQGFAWAGSAGVQRVEVSADSGASWQPAELVGISAPWAWRAWSADVELSTPGAASVMARATDGRGEVQPLQAQPNAGGYGNNSIHQVSFRVA